MKKAIIHAWLGALILIGCVFVVGHLDYQDKVLAEQQAAEVKRKREEALQEHKNKVNDLLKQGSSMSNIHSEMK